MRTLLLVLLLTACAETPTVPDVVKNLTSSVSTAERLLDQAQPLVEACQASPATRGCPEFLKGYDATERATRAVKQALVLGKNAAPEIHALLNQVRALGQDIARISAAEADASAP